MKFSKIILLAIKFANGRFMGGWINASPSNETDKIEIEYFQSWFSLESGYERGCSEDDIIRGHHSQAQFLRSPGLCYI